MSQDPKIRIYPSGGVRASVFRHLHVHVNVHIYSCGRTHVASLCVHACGQTCFCLCMCMQYVLEKATAPHSSTLAWKIPWTEEPGGLKSMGSLRVGHD